MNRHADLKTGMGTARPRAPRRRVRSVFEGVLRYIRGAFGGARERLLAGREEPMERKYWTLLAVAAANGEPVTPVQLQKSLFVLGEEMRAEVAPNFYEFAPYDYGPFCADVYSDADELAAEGLVELLPSTNGRWTNYRATAAGLAHAGRIVSTTPRAASYLKEVVAWTRSLSFSDLVRAIYAKFPKMRANSVFQG